MTPRDFSRFWMPGPSGLIVPHSIVVDGLHYPIDDADYLQQLRLTILNRRVAMTPSFRDIWVDPEPTIEEAAKAIPQATMIDVLSRFTNTYNGWRIDREQIARALRHALRADEKVRLQAFENAARAGGRLVHLLHDFATLLAIELVLIHGDDSAPPCAKHEIPRAAYRLVTLVSARMQAVEPDQWQGAGAGIAAAIGERSLFGRLSSVGPRAFGFWAWPDLQSSKAQAARQFFSDQLQGTFGLSLREWLAALARPILASLSRTFEAMTDTTPCLVLPGVRPARARVLQAIAPLSSGLADLQRICIAEHTKRSVIAHPNLFPLVQSPLLALGDDHYLPLAPHYLIRALLDFPLARATSASARPTGIAHYADLQEEYVHALLRYRFRDRYQVLRVAKTDLQPSRADGVIWYPSGCVIVEFKSRRVSPSQRFLLRTDEKWREQLQEIDIPKAVDQIESTTEDIISGRIPQNCPSCAVVGSLIIMSESLPLSVITGEVWHRVLPPSRTVAGVERLRPQIMDLAELESLEQWSDHSLLDLLRKKQHVRDLSIEPLTEFCMMRSFHRGRLRLLPDLWDGLVDLCRQEFAR